MTENDMLPEQVDDMWTEFLNKHHRNYLPPNFPKIITLCGSTRFMAEYTKATREETLKGNIVISVGLFGHMEGLDMTGDVKKMLDQLHLRKIDLADEILVINPKTTVCLGCEKPCSDFRRTDAWVSDCCRRYTQEKAYIGESTKREIEYATKHKKVIRYLEEQS